MVEQLLLGKTELAVVSVGLVVLVPACETVDAEVHCESESWLSSSELWRSLLLRYSHSPVLIQLLETQMLTHSVVGELRNFLLRPRLLQVPS